MTRDFSAQFPAPSLFDRLLGLPLPKSPADAAEAVRRDLEHLLNTRQTHQGLAEHLPEVRRSLIAYGLPDLPSLDAHTTAQKLDIARMIRQAIQQFEPRLNNVRVTLLDPETPAARTLPFCIEGELVVAPGCSVLFETALDLASGQYTVQPSP